MTKPSKRARKHDESILKYVGYFRRVTSHQVLYHHFIATGLSPSSGGPVIRRLIDEGLLSEEPLDPGRGSASRRVLHLTKIGWARIGYKLPSDFGKEVSEPVREYRMQFAEMHSVRKAEGWRLVKKENAWKPLRTWLLRDYRGRLLNDSDRVYRDRLERLQEFESPLNLLYHPSSGDLRFIAPARKGFGLDSRLANLPATGLWPDLHFELIHATAGDLSPAEETIKNWARKAKLNAETHHVAHHRSRPLPRDFWQAQQQKQGGPPPSP